MNATHAATQPFGIDFGGTGIKGAPVDLDKGEFAAERTRIDTPPGAKPEDVAEVVAELVDQGAAPGAPVGITVPGIVSHGEVRLAANIDKSWVGTDAVKLFGERLGRNVVVVNDADAAGLAEVRYGAAKDHTGLVIITTLGTGIGSAMVYDGVLVPNAELGHLEMNGKDAEHQAANSARERKEMSWHHWGKLLTQYYTMVEMLFSPDLFVVGGGVSKHAAKFLPHVKIRTPIVPAQLRNQAGIVGAAVLASEATTGSVQTSAVSQP